jgi:hypothetical protein
MRTVDATIEIRPDGSMSVRLGAGLGPGEHRGLFVLDEPASAETPAREVLSLPPLKVGFDPTLTFRREDIYGDDEA